MRLIRASVHHGAEMGAGNSEGFDLPESMPGQYGSATGPGNTATAQTGMNAREIYEGSDGEATTALYNHLSTLGPAGVIARDLFRAQKCSERAKDYSRRYKSEAYARKQWSLGLLVNTLADHRGACSVTFGWKRDPKPPIGYPWVLYIDTPDGQCSFHMPIRGEGPDYPGEWDNSQASADVVIKFTERVLAGLPLVLDDGPVTMTPADLEHIAANVPTSPGANVLSTEPDDDYQAKLAAWKRKHRYRE